MVKMKKDSPSRVVIVPRPSVPNDTSTVAKSGLEDALKRAPAPPESGAEAPLLRKDQVLLDKKKLPRDPAKTEVKK